MARRRRRSHRRHHSMSRYHRRGRGLRGFLDPVYTGSVGAGQVLLGAAVGTVGAAVVKMGLNKITTKVEGADVPLLAEKGMLGFLGPVVPLVSASLAGTALYLVQKKSPMGQAHLVGSVAAGAAISVMDYLKTVKNAQGNYVFADYVLAPRYANYVMAPQYGVLGNNPAAQFAPSYGVHGSNPMVSYDGVIASNPRLAAVTASAMGAMGDYDMMDAFAA